MHQQLLYVLFVGVEHRWTTSLWVTQAVGNTGWLPIDARSKPNKKQNQLRSQRFLQHATQHTQITKTKSNGLGAWKLILMLVLLTGWLPIEAQNKTGHNKINENEWFLLVRSQQTTKAT